MCQYFYPEYISSSTLPTELAEDLTEKGFNVDVICGYPEEYYNGRDVPKKENYKNINIRRVKYTKYSNEKKMSRLINFFSFFVSIFMKIPSLLSYKCIVVYSNPPILPLIPYIISRISKTKFIFVAFDVYPNNAIVLGAIKKGSMNEKIMNYINKKVYSKASKVIAISYDMKKYLVERNIAIKPEIVEVIPNWYTDKSMLKEKNIVLNNSFKKLRSEWQLILLYSGNMGTAQDMETILQAMLRYKNDSRVLFIFSGHGNKTDYISNFIKVNKIENVKMYGFLLGSDYRDVLSISDICLVSLEKGVEGLGVPSKTYGYLASGKPVISIMSSNTDIAKNLIQYRAGFNINQGDIESMVGLISELIKKPTLILSMKKNAERLFTDLYERRINTNKYYEVITNIINK